MGSQGDYDVTTFEWDLVLGIFHEGIYPGILEEVFDYNSAVLELVQDTQVGVQYNPDLVGVEQDPADQVESTNKWDELSAKVIAALRPMLVEYGMPPEHASAVEVGQVGAVFMSPVGCPGASVCVEWHRCGSGRYRSLCCPC